MIKWKDPPIPNGPIIKYMIEYDKGGLSQVGKFFFNVGDLVIQIYHGWHLCNLILKEIIHRLYSTFLLD
jgi:hypothetical protein